MKENFPMLKKINIWIKYFTEVGKTNEKDAYIYAYWKKK